MSEKVSWSLLTLPIDIIYRILYQIDNFTIFCSIRGVCARVNAILVTYYRYQNLTTLVLKHYRIGNEDVQRLSTALKNDTTLTILSLNDNGVEALGTQYLADALPNNKLNPSWKAKDITKFLHQSENPPCYTTRRALWLKVWRILKRNQVNDLPRSGAPRTTATTEYLQAVKKNC
ncbi:unnamed protein product [Rotaria magnacalcarata]|uniref:F-box domain-containing protein n=1 Tax=Rotaria magnacalcarata TaxID=392030 RepID=A0A8S2PZ87_9BILA|nr:unnamed protein product [Rotaria magnacalcarata]